MSGLRKTLPTSGTCPPGRNTRAVAGNCRNRASLSRVCWAKVSSTTKPSRASSSAGSSSSASGRVPSWRAARAHRAGVPGTPTERPELTTVAKSSGAPDASVKTSSSKLAGAASRPSSVVTSPVRAS